MPDAAPRHPFWLKCLDCSHVWIGCYLPMELRLAAQIMQDARCPMCGATSARMTPAKQTGGALLEPQA